MSAERGHPPSRPQPGPPPAHGGPRRLPAAVPSPADGQDERRVPAPVPPGSGERDAQRGRRRMPPAGPPGAGERSPRSPAAFAPATGQPVQGRSLPGGGAASAGIEPIASRGPRRLAKPKPVRVQADNAGRPQLVGRREVDAVRESWLVEDRWWTDAPLRRRYWEVVTGDGRDLVVFRDLEEGRWYTQR